MALPFLSFRDIAVARDGATCVAFRVDAHECADVGAESFLHDAGPNGERYLANLAQWIASYPGLCMHAWYGERIIGQIELMPNARDRLGADLALLYLIPEFRGRGFGVALERQAIDVLHRHRYRRAWLHVHEANKRAIALYRKTGWQDRGPAHGREWMRLMVKAF